MSGMQQPDRQGTCTTCGRILTAASMTPVRSIACFCGGSAPVARTWVYDPQGDDFPPATAGNNRRVHLVREVWHDHNLTMCGAETPRSPQTTQEPLPKCQRCFGRG